MEVAGSIDHHKRPGCVVEKLALVYSKGPQTIIMGEFRYACQCLPSICSSGGPASWEIMRGLTRSWILVILQEKDEDCSCRLHVSLLVDSLIHDLASTEFWLALLFDLSSLP